MHAQDGGTAEPPIGSTRFAAVAAAPDLGVGAWVWDIARSEISWSDTIYAILGISRHMLPRPTLGAFLEFVHPDDSAATMATVSASLSGVRSSHEQRFRIIRPDGEVRDILSRAVLTRDAAGRPLRLDGIDVDLGPAPSSAPSTFSAAKALHDSEETFRAIAESLPSLVFMSDAQGRNTYVNSSFCALAGRPPSGLLGHAWLDLVNPDDLGPAAEIWARSSASGIPFESEYRFRRHDGVWRWFLVRSIPQKDANGVLTSWIGIATDITARKEAEGALRDGEKRLELALRAGRTGVWDWNLVTGDVMRQGQVLAVLGLGERDYNPASYLQTLHPEDAARVQKAVAEAVERHELYSCEYRVIHKDGSIRWVADQAQPYYDEAGRPVRLLGTITDITDRKLAEQALSESEQRLRMASDAAGLGFHDFNVRTGEINWSPGLWRLTGRSGTNPVALADTIKTIHPPDREMIEAQISAIQRRLGPYELEFRIVRPDGSFTWVLDRGEALGPLDPATGLVSRIAGTIIDITARKRSEEHEKLLMHEMNHRTKNLMSVVQAVAQQTAKHGTHDNIVERLNERLHSLAASHDLLVRNSWQGVELRDLVVSQLSHFGDLNGNRIVLDGPPCGSTPRRHRAWAWSCTNCPPMP